MLRAAGITLSLLTLFTLPAIAKETTHEFTLENGLKIVVREDHRAPVVVSHVWYRVGSSFETGGITGISHALEHMMFKGTQLHPAGVFSRTIAQNGGKENAFTNDDYTGYFQEMEAKRLPISLKLEADRMQNLTIPDDEFKKEIEVIKEERRMRIDDDPQATTYERFHAAAHLANPYHHMTIGWMDDLNHMTAEDLRHWYKNWYTPNNAVLIVVGDVDPKEVLREATQAFGKIPARPTPKIKPQQEAAPLGMKRLQVHAPANLPVLYMGYNVPSLLTLKNPEDAYVLEVISGVLDAGDSSRFRKELVRKEMIAANASASYDLYNRFDGLFTLDGIPSAQKSTQELEKAILKQIQRLQTELVDTAELDRVKAQIMAAKVFARDSLMGQSMQIGQLEVIGLSWREADNYLKQVQSVTPTQIREVAQRYLTEKRLTIAELIPEKINDTKNSPAKSLQRGSNAHTH